MKRKPESQLPVLPSAPRFADSTPFASTARGQELLERFKSAFARPIKSPIQHWRHILETATEGSISHRFAQEAIADIERKRKPNNG